jgi:predicted Rossmann fold nucleotide-binding protein DprA/Smf involved in DNA uptake
MKLAIIGSRNAGAVNIAAHITERPTEVVSGGARGVDTYAAQYANEQGIPLKVFKPDYRAHLQGAPIRRNELIVQYADKVLAFWDGKSKGTKYVIEYARKHGKQVQVVQI